MPLGIDCSVMVKTLRFSWAVETLTTETFVLLKTSIRFFSSLVLSPAGAAVRGCAVGSSPVSGVFVFQYRQMKAPQFRNKTTRTIRTSHNGVGLLQYEES